MERVSHRKDVFPATVAYLGTSGFRPVDVRAELTRKSLHLLIAFTPAIALVGLSLAVFSLAAGILAYTFMERLRLSGVRVPVISALTSLSCRERDVGRFVLGPVTLGCGALLALLLFPLQAASVGIFALAFGDGFASLVGRLFGRIRPAFLFGKSVEGSAACFGATFLSVYLLTRNHLVALAVAVLATALEALPLEDYDNIVLPLAVGFAVQWIL